MAERYRKKRGGQFDAEHVQQYGRAIERIAGRRGQVTTDDVLGAAADPAHVLHGLFEWDDAIAGGRFRAVQARNVINHILVVREVDGKEVPVPAFVSVVVDQPGDEPPQRVYVTLKTAEQKPLLAEQAMNDALAELRSWRKKYAALRGVFGQVFELVDALEA